jgi:hypothetical protein
MKVSVPKVDGDWRILLSVLENSERDYWVIIAGLSSHGVLTDHALSYNYLGRLGRSQSS